jgi:predicted nucleotidyltransferase
MVDSKLYDYVFYGPLIQEFLSRVKQVFGGNLVSVILFGSVARRQAKKESDIDLLVILRDASDDHYERLKPLVDVELRMRKSAPYEEYLREGLIPCFSYIVLSKGEAEENHYVFLDMLEDSIILFDDDNYFRGRLVALKKRLSSLGSKKVLLSDGSWYWDLKPDLRLGEEFVL